MRKAKWLLLIAVLAMILLLNLQGPEASVALSSKVGSILKTVFKDNSVWIESHIRKLGHSMEYCLLGIVSYWCFGWKGLLFSAALSVFDQCFKELIPVRYFDITDLPYDMGGYLLGSCTAWAVKKIRERRRNRNAH